MIVSKFLENTWNWCNPEVKEKCKGNQTLFGIELK
jgi:hypothetical protein